MVNMFNEKVFLFLWWWFLIVSIVTCLNFAYWLGTFISPMSKRRFIKRYLKARQLINTASAIDRRSVLNFLSDFLRLDGVFVLRLIGDNAGDLICTDIVGKLYEGFKTQTEKGNTSRFPVSHPLLPAGKLPEKIPLIDSPEPKPTPV